MPSTSAIDEVPLAARQPYSLFLPGKRRSQTPNGTQSQRVFSCFLDPKSELKPSQSKHDLPNFSMNPESLSLHWTSFFLLPRALISPCHFFLCQRAQLGSGKRKEQRCLARLGRAAGFSWSKAKPKGPMIRKVPEAAESANEKAKMSLVTRPMRSEEHRSMA